MQRRKKPTRPFLAPSVLEPMEPRRLLSGVIIRGNSPPVMGITAVAVSNNHLFYTAGAVSSFSAPQATQLWVADAGNTSGRMIKEFFDTSFANSPGIPINQRTGVFDLVDAAGHLYFTAYEGGSGSELWTSDGTIDGTRIVKDIVPGSGSSSPRTLTPFNGQLVFVTTDAGGASHLWITDGTDADTTELFAAPATIISAGNPGVFDNKLFFTTTDNDGNLTLYSTDGSAAGTTSLGVLGTVIGGTPCVYFNAVNGKLIVTLNVASSRLLINPPSVRTALWATDGTPLGATPLLDLPFTLSSNQFRGPPVIIDQTLYFNGQQNLWKTDGTPAGTVLVKQLDDAGGLEHLTVAGDRLYFTNSVNSFSGTALWQSDGTDAGTVLAQNALGGFSAVSNLLDYQGSLHYLYDDGGASLSLRRVVGAPPSTQLLSVIGPHDGTSLQELKGTEAGNQVLGAFADGTIVARALATTLGDTIFAAPLNSHTISTWHNGAAGSFEAFPAVASLIAPPAVANGQTSVTFSLTFNPAVALDSADNDTTVEITNIHSFWQPRSFTLSATFLGVSPNDPRTLLYSFTAPGGSFDPADGSGYTVTSRPASLKDVDGNFYLPIAINFQLPIDTSPPTANFYTRDPIIDGAASTLFRVYYDDPSTIDTATLDDKDVYVVGPTGDHLPLTYQSFESVGTNSILATYSLAAPGGAWDRSDVGSYTLFSAAGEIQDVFHNATVADAPILVPFTVDLTPHLTILFHDLDLAILGNRIDLGFVLTSQNNPLSFTLVNDGTADLHLLTPVVPDGFTITKLPSPLLHPGQSDTLGIQFTPTSNEPSTVYGGDVSIPIDNLSPASFSVRASVGVMTCTVLVDGQPLASLASPIEFHALQESVFTIRNDGNVPFTSEQPQLPEHFHALVQAVGIDDPAYLGPGESIDWKIRFDYLQANSPQTYPGSITFPLLGPEQQSVSVPVLGRPLFSANPLPSPLGTPHLTVVYPPEYAGEFDFGAVARGKQATRSIQIQNSGTGFLTIDLQDLPAGFSTGVFLTRFIGAGQSITLNLVFSPPASSNALLFGGTIHITSNAPEGTIGIPVRAERAPGDVSLNSVSLPTFRTPMAGKARVQLTSFKSAPQHTRTHLRLFASADQTLDASDIEVGSAMRTLNLKADQTKALDVAVRLPRTLADGPYYLIAALSDVHTGVPSGPVLLTQRETFASTGTFAFGHKRADLAPRFSAIPVTLTPGASQTVSFKLAARAPHRSPGDFSATLLLTTDDALDAIEASLGSITSSFSPTAANRTYTLTFTTPADLPAGIHTLLLTVQPVSPLIDPDLSNNHVFSHVTIG